MAKMKTREMMAEAIKMPGIIGGMARQLLRQPEFNDWADIADIVSGTTFPFDQSEQDLRDKRRSVFRRPLRYSAPRSQRRSLALATSANRHRQQRRG